VRGDGPRRAAPRPPREDERPAELCPPELGERPERPDAPDPECPGGPDPEPERPDPEPERPDEPEEEPDPDPERDPDPLVVAPEPEPEVEPEPDPEPVPVPLPELDDEDWQDSDSLAIGVVIGSEIEESGVPGGTFTVNVSCCPVIVTTEILQTSAAAGGGLGSAATDRNAAPASAISDFRVLDKVAWSPPADLECLTARRSCARRRKATQATGWRGALQSGTVRGVFALHERAERRQKPGVIVVGAQVQHRERSDAPW
jgi:hypothetical protein